MYLLFQFQMNKKEKEIWEFKMDFKKSFFCRHSNLSNDDNFLEYRSENWYAKMKFFSLKEGQDLKNQVAHPDQEFQ